MNSFRRISFKYELLNSSNTFKRTLRNVRSCKVSFKFLSQLKSSATIILDEIDGIDWLNDRIKIYVTIDGVTIPLGVYLMCTPSREITSTSKIRNVTCYSLLQILLDDKLESKLTLPIGTNVINEVKRQIGSNCSINESEKTLNSEKIYEIGTSKLEIINDLLSAINYNSLRVDGDGRYITEEYVLPTDREIDRIYEEGSDSIIISEMTDEIDLFNVPNVFVRYTNSLDTEKPLTYTYVNENEESITSTVSRGRRIVDAQETEATDIEALAAITKKEAYEMNSVYSHLYFSTAIDLKVLNIFMPVVWVKVGDIDDKYSITSIEFDCKTGTLASIESRKVINI